MGHRTTTTLLLLLVVVDAVRKNRERFARSSSTTIQIGRTGRSVLFRRGHLAIEKRRKLDNERESARVQGGARGPLSTPQPPHSRRFAPRAASAASSVIKGDEYGASSISARARGEESAGRGCAAAGLSETATRTNGTRA